MSDHRFWKGTIRKLWQGEGEKFGQHLLRLDSESRRMRFAHAVSDAFIKDYASRMHHMGSIVYGYFEDGELRAAAELRKLDAFWGEEAEAAFSVERPWQNRGIGTELMGRVIRAARNRGVKHLYMSCLAENTKMQAIARKHDAMLRFERGDVMGEIVPQGPDYFSVMAEDFEDRVSFILAVLDLQYQSKAAA